MPALFKLAIAAAATLAVVEAACPNACSGHGQCGQYDACTCHADYTGGDCSQRVCPHAFAWVTTNANGDIDGDGKRTGVTVYDSDHTFKTSGFDYVISQNAPHGTWEQWPAFGNTAGKDEGHYYMECANRGICDRSTGECVCFDGYTGSGCRRSVCPNDCSGHGVCQTVTQMNSVAYTLWDKDMSRACVCDKGFFGPDCAERKCPLGDDPLTTGEANEVQWVDISTPRDDADNTDRTFAGSIRLKYTDPTGRIWETDSIDVEPHLSTADGSMAAKVAEALNGLPNGVLSGVTVTQGYAEKVIPGNLAVTATAVAAASNGATGLGIVGKLLRCPEGGADIVFLTKDGTDMFDYADVAITGYTPADDTTCYEVAHQWSVRFKITFPNQPGNLAPLEVDVSDVTVEGSDNVWRTNAQRGDTLVQSAVTSQLEVGSHHSTGGLTAEYIVPSSVSYTCPGTTETCAIASKTITGDAIAAQFFPTARVKISCNDVSRGTFTVASITDVDNIVVAEDIADNADCGNTKLIVTLDSHFVLTNADLRGMVANGDRLVVAEWAAKTTTPAVERVQWVAEDGEGRVFLTAAHHTSALAATDGATTVKLAGDGTTESDECSARGLCDRATGVCKCFKGYTGGACSIQNALSLGFGDL